MAPEEIIINAQLALFFDKEKLIARPDELVSSFNDAIGKPFDQVPMVVPVPNDQQLNMLPIVQMISKNGIYSCNIARGRADFIVAGEGEQKLIDIKVNFLEKVGSFYDFFASKTFVSRIGFVVRFLIPDTSPEAKIKLVINDDFNKIFDGEQIYEAYTRYISRTTINDLKVNNFTTLEKTSAKIGSGQRAGILLTRDFNTVPEENYKNSLSSEVVKQFIETASGRFKVEEIKKILWPTEKK